jgi:ADP-L-glycero-D-manno-heptose 6-epimerase
MKVLVTGHKGFIGQNLCKALYEEGWDTTTFDIVDNPTLRPKDLDLEGVDCVMHLGAISSTTEKDVRKIMDQNLSWSIELFEECREQGIHMQFASSASVYGNNKGQRILSENDVCYPSSYYAMSKYMFEQYVQKRAYGNISSVFQIFRYFNVYGPHEEHKGNQASPYTQFAKQAKETGVIKVFKGSEKIYRDFVHVDTVVAAHIQGLKKKDEFSGGTYNVGSGYPRSFLDVAKDIALLHNARIETIQFPEHLKEHYQYYTHANISKLKDLLAVYG